MKKLYSQVSERIARAMSSCEEGQNYAYGGGGLVVLIIVVVVVVLLLR